jgi:hypothetical protein
MNIPAVWTRATWRREAAAPAIPSVYEVEGHMVSEETAHHADRTTDLVAVLTAEVARLRGELHDMQRLVDDLLDRESMIAGAACMEQLATAAVIARVGAPRARRLVVDAEQTAAGSVVAA